jgi:hypothetical protein
VHPTAATSVVPVGDWTGTWSSILHQCRLLLGGGATTIHLPVSLLASWSCPACGTREVPRNVHVPGEPVLCTRCATHAIPELTTQVTADDPWLGSSPAAMNVPPWTWATAVAGEEHRDVELQSAPRQFSTLFDGGVACSPEN